MIGQEDIKRQLLQRLYNNILPKVIIIVGEEGYGKKTLVKWFSQETNIPYTMFNNSIDSVREAINLSIQESTKQFYVFENIEDNRATQNAILKLLEDSPINTYFFLLVKDISILLPTVINRGIQINIPKYRIEDLKQFNSDELALKIFDNPSQLIRVKDTNLQELINTTNKIIEKLDIANISNALKLSSYIKSKDNPDGYDLDIFIKALKYSFLDLYTKTKDDSVERKFKIYEQCLINAKQDQKFFMDQFIIKNYMEIKGWKY